MEKKYYISKSSDLPKSMDFAFLKAEGIRLVQQLSSDIWTDYNAHDPGVTILEQLCYAITELGYRIDFDIEQILTNNQGKVDQLEGHTFFPIRDMLPSAVLTPHDYRKYLLDRVRFSFSKDKKLEPDNRGIRVLTNVWINPIVDRGVQGLYRILIQIDDDYLKYEEEIKKEVTSLFLRNRNLGEDLYEVVVLKEYPLSIKASIDLNPEAIPEAILAQILFELEMVVTPRIKRYSINELKSQGYSMDKIFEGPLPERSVMKDEDLNKFTSIVYKPRLVKAISGVEGVRRVRLFQVFKRDVLVSEDIISLEDNAEDCFLVIDTLKIIEELKGGEQPLKFYQGNTKIEVDVDGASHILKGLWSNFENDFSLSNINNPPNNTQGQGKPLDVVSPIANQFPEIYGIGKRGLPNSASFTRKNKAEQLKTFLLLFDQIIANYLSQLTHVHNLFSTKLNVKDTYATRFPAPFNLDHFSTSDIIKAKVLSDKPYFDRHKKCLSIVAEEIYKLVKEEEKEQKIKKIRFSLTEKLLIIDETLLQQSEIIRERISGLSAELIKSKIEGLKKELFEELWKDWTNLKKRVLSELEMLAKGNNEDSLKDSDIGHGKDELERILKEEAQNLFEAAFGWKKLSEAIEKKDPRKVEIKDVLWKVLIISIQSVFRRAAAEHILDLLKRQQIETEAIKLARHAQIKSSDKKSIKEAMAAIELRIKNDEELNKLNKSGSSYDLLDTLSKYLLKKLGIELIQLEPQKLKVKERTKLLASVLRGSKTIKHDTKFVRWNTDSLKSYQAISKFISRDLFQFWSKAQKALQVHDSYTKRKNKFADHLLARFGERLFEDQTEARIALNPELQKEDFEQYLVQTKLKIVKKIVDLTKNRSKAFDYSKLKKGKRQGSEEDISSGFERKLSLLLNIPYASSPFIKNLLDKTRLGFSSLNSKSGRKHNRSDDLLSIFLASGHLDKFYQELKTEERQEGNKRHQLVFKLEAKNETVLLHESATSEKLKEYKEKLIKFTKTFQKKTEAFYLLEHILLRPLRPTRYRYSLPVETGSSKIKMESNWYDDEATMKFASDLITFHQLAVEKGNFSLEVIKDSRLVELNKKNELLIDQLKNEVMSREERKKIEKKISDAIKKVKRELLNQALEAPELTEDAEDRIDLELAKIGSARDLEADGIYRIALLDKDQAIFIQSTNLFIDEAEATEILADFQEMLNEFVDDLQENIYDNPEEIYDKINIIEDPKIIVNKDEDNFFHHQASLIFPAWCSRLRNRSFQRLLQSIIMKDFPAHLKLNIHWLNITQMSEFEPMYARWLRDKSGDDLYKLDQASLKLQNFLMEDHPLTI